MDRRRKNFHVTIPAGESESGTIDLLGGALAGILLRSTSWTTANIGIKINTEDNDDTFVPLRTLTGTIAQIENVVAASGYPTPATEFPFRYIKLWSQTAGESVVQAAEREFDGTIGD